MRRDNTNPSRLRATVGLGYVGAAFVAFLATVTPDPHPGDHLELRVAAVVSLAAALVLGLGRRLPFGVLKLIAVPGAIILNSVNLAVSWPIGPTLLFYVWPAFTAGYFCTRRERVANYLVLVVCVSVALTLSPARGEALPLLSCVATVVVFVVIAVSVADLSTREDRLVAALHHAASTDPLTGLLNRRAWEAAFNELVEQADRSGRSLSVALFDLDHFKLVNDRFGHAAGDEALRIFAVVLTEACGEHDLPSRSGGEEFTVALPGRDAASAADFAGTVARTLAARTRDTETPLTVSAGVAALTHQTSRPGETSRPETSRPGETSRSRETSRPETLRSGETSRPVRDEHGLRTARTDALLRAADQALYAAKEAGRDRVHTAPAVPARS